uniref:Bro-N domain-containing protein n=1 Tax=Eubacterium plexicaudatum ASF492 TaxID=1235802 RepID=N2A1Z6_9FIRM
MIAYNAKNSEKEDNNVDEHGDIIIYQTEDGLTKIDVSMQDETVWLTQEQMAELFQRDKSTISRHIKNIFAEGELNEKVVVAEFATTSQHGAMEGKTQSNITKFYNLDVIISVGYRVKSQRGVQFRIWATNILKEYIKKGFAMDDDRLKELGGGGYFKELLERIRDIRASEKVFYRQVLEIYATSVDYNPNAAVSIQFFKRVQNKIHYAVSGETAAEVIYHRADAEKDFMGLMTFSGYQPTLREAKIAKNYLDEKELRAMGQLVSGYLDFAERQAEREIPMTMEDWAKHLDGILTSTGENLLIGNGTISHNQAMDKAQTEYKKYKAKTISSVEQDYLDSIKQLEQKGKKQ